jgi:eukaryotic-like serine/threonine-protein kinase
MAEPRRSIEDLQTVWASLGIDPGELAIDSQGSILNTLPLEASSQLSSVRLPRLAVGAADRRAPELMIGRTLGSGGMGIIRQATQIPLGREVVVKAAHGDQRRDIATSQLLREARVVGALEHPNIIPVHMLGCDEHGAPMMVMKRVDGVPWGDLVRDPDHPARPRDGRDLLEFHLQIMLQVCNAVEFAHSRGILHRDLKPDNVMVGAFGEVYVVDWGAAVATRDDWRSILPLASEVTRLAGTPQYMAPEMATADGSRIDERTDVYLLGATLHECMTGKPRHSGPTVTSVLYRAYASEPVRYGPSVPPELAAICNRATHADPAQRFASVADLRTALVQFLRHRTSTVLCREARTRLDGLQALLGRRDEVESILLDEQTHVQLSECRFAFQQALKEWPENPEARAGLGRALELMADYQLTRGDHRAAAVLISEMREPPEALRQRLDVLRRRTAEEKAQVEHLRHLERALDSRIGHQARSVFAFAVAIIFAAVTLTNGYAERHALWTVGLGLFAIEVAGFGVVMAVGVYLARRVLLRTRVNRFIVATAGVLAGTMLTLTLGCSWLGVSARAAMVLQLLLISTAIGALGVAVDRRFWVACLVYLGGFLVGAAFPQWTFEVRAVSHLLALGYIAIAWHREPPALDVR